MKLKPMMLEKKENRIKKYYNKVKFVITGLIATVTFSPMNVYANDDSKNFIVPDSLKEDPEKFAMSAIMNIVFKVAFLLGVAMLIKGIADVVKSFASNNSESRTQGLTYAIVGIVLMALEVIIVATKLLEVSS